jgi:Zinc binding domain
MNKAFVREPDSTADYCPRCGSKGEPVGTETLKAFLTDEQRGAIAESANFCPAPKCDVVYFDSFERAFLTTDLQRPVYPKDPTAPICACFGLTRDDIEQDVREGVTTRVKAVIEKAKTPAARCRQMAANGKPCIAYVQKCYMQCLQDSKRDS